MGLKLFSVGRNITDSICLEGTNPGWEMYKEEVPHRYLIWACLWADGPQLMCLMWRRFISPSSFLSQPSYIYQLLLLMHRFREHWSQKWTTKTLPLLFQLICWRPLMIFYLKGLFSRQKRRGRFLPCVGQHGPSEQPWPLQGLAAGVIHCPVVATIQTALVEKNGSIPQDLYLYAVYRGLEDTLDKHLCFCIFTFSLEIFQIEAF